MSAPTEKDQTYYTGGQGMVSAADLLARSDPSQSENVWARSPLDEVRHNLTSVSYPDHQIEFVKGRVEDTLPTPTISQIALLRLDTDWYESTRHELQHLYPHLMRRGILIIDDYGHWEGARKANTSRPTVCRCCSIASTIPAASRSSLERHPALFVRRPGMPVHSMIRAPLVGIRARTLPKRLGTAIWLAEAVASCGGVGAVIGQALRQRDGRRAQRALLVPEEAFS